MKSLLTILLSFLFFSINAQCLLDMDVAIDSSGNIVTTNNSTGASPIYYWSVYNLDLDPWTTGAEYVKDSLIISYLPMYVGNYLVCLNGSELGNNNDCDSVCEPVEYTQGMMDLQSTLEINDLWRNAEIIIYPVPARTILNIIGGDLTQKTEFHVFDMLGKKCDVELTNDGNITMINVGVLSSGIYLLKYYSKKTLMETTLRFSVE